MGKIAEYIEKNNLLPKDCVYHTWRDLKNSKKAIAGKIRVLVPPKSTTAMVEYICPECKNSGYVEKEWKRPFSVKCEKCGARMTVPKLKQEALKDAKGSNVKA